MYAFLVPPVQVPDENSHLVRAYAVSRGACIATPDVSFPKSFDRLFAAFSAVPGQAPTVAPGDIDRAFRIPLNEADVIEDGRKRSLEGFVNQNAYHCAPYLPAAVVLFIGRRLDASPLTLMYLGRLVNLITYVLLTYLALRLLPEYRWILVGVALAPMALHQAAAVSADPVVLALGFVLCAYVLRLALAPDPGPIGWRQHAILALLVVLLIVSKSMLWVVVLVFLVQVTRPGPAARRLAVAGAHLALGLACLALWHHVNLPNTERQAEERLARVTIGLPSIDVAANVRFMVERPVDVARVMLRGFTAPAYLYRNFAEMVGVMGWRTALLPAWVVALYAMLLAGAAAAQSSPVGLTRAARLTLLAAVVAGIGNTWAQLWVLETPRSVIDSPLQLERILLSAQGRYWLPLAVPLLVLCSIRMRRPYPRAFAVAAAGVILVASAVAFSVVRTTFYR